MARLDSLLKNIFEANKAEALNKSLDKRVYLESASNAQVDYIRPEFNQLRKVFGKTGPCFSAAIGSHPEFSNLKEEQTEYHYIVSVFMDISGSTKLGLKFDLPKVRFYKNAILRSAIEIFQALDGHIHRLQGDAVFAFFGGKDIKKADAIINAINAASLMQAFNKTALTSFFEENGLEPLKIRIGIDIGDDSEVLWSQYGIADISEITTTSIHTDLAAKLQARARGNNVMLGENVFTYLDLPDKYLKIKSYQENYEKKEDKYIIENPNYSMRLFDWESYLDEFPYSVNGDKDTLFAPDFFEVKCFVVENGIEYEYKSNSYALNKNLRLKFVFMPKMLSYDNIKWHVENTGQEATAAGKLDFAMSEYEGKTICYQSTSHNGHHHMVCTIFDRKNKIMVTNKFGIYISDNLRSLKSLAPVIMID